MFRRLCRTIVVGCTTLSCLPAPAARADIQEDVYRGDLVSFPGPWGFQIGKSAIILVSDQQLKALSDPDRKIDLSLTFDKQEASLRQLCERAKAAGQHTLILAFDQFFTQYRPGQAGPRSLTPDMDEYVQRIAAISRFAQGYGLGLELSLLSPLEIGPAYARKTGESGLWLHYREGLRDPTTGAYSVSLWRQLRWVNNKGPIDVRDAGVRVFAFQESRVGGTLYRSVPRDRMVEITETARVETLGSRLADGRAVRIRVSGKGEIRAKGLDRVLVIQQYRTPEMDYFSDRVLPYLKQLIDKYADAGVKLNALYADEMHIQQDWSYFSHHDAGEFAMRYVSPGLSKRFASLFGEEYRDLAPFMVYFAGGQEDFANDLTAKASTQHVFGGSPPDIRRTALFRARYYHLLQDGVVDLFAEAKRYAEKRMGHRLEARAHATWAESPTIDYWRTGVQPMYRSAYEYTSNFVWSDIVHQAASACHDYFKWGDFLTGNGNDHAEGGYADRDYFALALACSTGILNDVPYSYAAHWGMPAEISRRRTSLVNTFGAAGSPAYGMVQEMQHRDVSVLMLYPLDLVAVEERFGSWMTQYGYANMVTQAKLLERGKVQGGAIEMAGRRFTTLVATFEPFPSRKLLAMMEALALSGGRVIWSGPPPVLSLEGGDALAPWQGLFGVDYAPELDEGRLAPGAELRFTGKLASVAPQTVLTDYLVDRVYPVRPRAGTDTVCTTKSGIVGSTRTVGRGSATFLGFRPRDDQSRSLGYETRTWFEVLSALGAYSPSGRFPGVNDNTEHLSRTTDFLTCRFPNGAVAVCRHFREMEEGWPGGFARKEEDDRRYMAQHPAPVEDLALTDFRVNGHTVTYSGREAMTFHVDGDGRLVAFAGAGCDRISVDGRETIFADKKVPFISWAPIPEARRVPGGAILQLMANGAATIRVPFGGATAVEVFAEGPTPGSRGERLGSKIEGGVLTMTLDGRHAGRWLYVVPR